MTVSTLNGKRVTRCRVQIPAWGIWWADVESDSDDVITGAASLVLGDVAFRGTVIAGGAVEQRTRYRIAGGAGGWGKTIAAKGEVNDLGVKYATVLNAAASACGETMGTIPSGTVGPAFVRASGPASGVLEELFPRGWYVDNDGVTHIGARASTTYTGSAPRMHNDAALGIVELAPEALAPLVPGVLVDGIHAVDVEHVLEGGVLRTTVWGARNGRTDDPLEDALRMRIEHVTAAHRFFAPWEYRVVTRELERYNLQPVRASAGMPDLQRVRVRPGVAGMKVHAKYGSIVTVQFLDGDPARPFIASFDDYDAPGFRPDDLYVQAGPTGASPTEHATSAEAMVNFVFLVLSQLATPLGGPATVSAAITAALGGAAAGSISTFKTALDGALAAKTANTTGNTPNMGWPNVRGG